MMNTTRCFYSTTTNNSSDYTSSFFPVFVCAIVFIYAIAIAIRLILLYLLLPMNREILLLLPSISVPHKPPSELFLCSHFLLLLMLLIEY